MANLNKVTADAFFGAADVPLEMGTREPVENAINAFTNGVLPRGRKNAKRQDYKDSDLDILFTWCPVQKERTGAFKALIIDRGCGMTPAEMLRNLGTLGNSTKGGEFKGLGGRAILKYNHRGLFYASRASGDSAFYGMKLTWKTARNPEIDTEKFTWNEEDEDGEVVEVTDEVAPLEAIEDYAYLLDLPQVKEVIGDGSGTIVLCEGRHEKDNSFLFQNGEDYINIAESERHYTALDKRYRAIQDAKGNPVTLVVDSIARSMAVPDPKFLGECDGHPFWHLDPEKDREYIVPGHPMWDALTHDARYAQNKKGAHSTNRWRKRRRVAGVDEALRRHGDPVSSTTYEVPYGGRTIKVELYLKPKPPPKKNGEKKGKDSKSGNLKVYDGMRAHCLGNEIYHLAEAPRLAALRPYGINYREVEKRVFIYVTWPHAILDSKDRTRVIEEGVIASTDRKMLEWRDKRGQKHPLPEHVVSDHVAKNLPDAIKAALIEARQANLKGAESAAERAEELFAKVNADKWFVEKKEQPTEGKGKHGQLVKKEDEGTVKVQKDPNGNIEATNTRNSPDPEEEKEEKEKKEQKEQKEDPPTSRKKTTVRADKNGRSNLRFKRAADMKKNAYLFEFNGDREYANGDSPFASICEVTPDMCFLNPAHPFIQTFLKEVTKEATWLAEDDRLQIAREALIDELMIDVNFAFVAVDSKRAGTSRSVESIGVENLLTPEAVFLRIAGAYNLKASIRDKLNGHRSKAV